MISRFISNKIRKLQRTNGVQDQVALQHAIDDVLIKTDEVIDTIRLLTERLSKKEIV